MDIIFPTHHILKIVFVQPILAISFLKPILTLSWSAFFSIIFFQKDKIMKSKKSNFPT